MTGEAFYYRGVILPYLRHSYNHADQNMRTVEIPIASYYTARSNPRRTLEVGNVLSHYVAAPHAVIDMREGKIKADVMTMTPPDKRFTLIVSISTLEHIGFGKYSAGVAYTPEQIEARLTGWLRDGGGMVATLPIGYNAEWDKAVADGALDATVHFMRRLDDANHWQECDLAEAFAADIRRWRWQGAIVILNWGIDAMENTPRRTLVLGAGNNILPGAVNHDLRKHRPEIDIAHDLNILPWPWADGEFDVVNAWAVLEHLYVDRLKLMNELWRITKPGGVAVLKLPAWDSADSHDDITHYWYATVRCMDQFDPRTKRGKRYNFYTPYKWHIERAQFSNRGESSIYFRLRKIAEEDDNAIRD